MNAVLHQVHALYLLDNSFPTPPFKDTAAASFIRNLHACQMNDGKSFPVTGEKYVIQKATTTSTHMMRDYNVCLPSHGGLLHKEVSLLPLFETLGPDKFLTLLSAALSERRILFVSDRTSVVSAAVLSCAAMIHPFTWHHILVPVLPTKLYDYASAPMPYIIGIRRAILQKFKAGVSIMRVYYTYICIPICPRRLWRTW